MAQALLSLPLGWGIGFNNLCMKAAGSLLETSMGKGLGILMSDKLEAPCRITWGRTGNLLIQANLPTQSHPKGSKELKHTPRRRE